MTATAQETMTGTMDVPDADKLDEVALTKWMEANVDGFEGPLSLSKFKGGQSNPTYKLDTPSTSYVLRRKPFGKLLPSAHAVDREFRIIAGLNPTEFPVPTAYGLCEDDSVIGSMFYVMGMADGRSFWDGTLPGMTPQQRTDIYYEMIDTLAALHAYDPAKIGLERHGKPGNYCERQLDRWSKQYYLSETETIKEMDDLIKWLGETIPPQMGSGIVHGDYRIDNMIFDSEKPKVIAVLDWELSTLGDPIVELSYLLMNWITESEGRAGLLGHDLEALGIPNLEQATARYCQKAGLESIPNLDWYFAFNMFRMAAILQGIKKRVIDGTASSAQAKEMSERVKPLAEMGWEMAKKAGAK